MKIREVNENKKQFIALLLLADEQENMIDHYLEKGTMRPLFDSYGNVYFAIDMELKGLIREAIMLMIPNFEVEIK